MAGKAEREYEKEKRRYEVYLEERKMLITGEQEEGTSFDKYLLTFATGTFALTITFIKDVTNNTLAQSTKWMIMLAWILLAATIVMMLISFLSGIKAFRKQDKIDRKWLLEDKGESEPPTNGWSTTTVVLNIASSATFVAAIVFLLLFVSNNLPFK